MTLALRDVKRDNRDLMRTLQPIIWSWRGEAGKGVPLTQTAVSSSTKYAVDAANGGTGGLALRAVGGANTFTVNTAGITASSLTVTNNFGVTGNMTVGGTLGVTGATTLSSTLSAGASTLATLSVTGDATIGDDLTVTDTLIVNGAATFNDPVTMTETLAVTGNTTIQGALQVDGNSTLGNGTGDTVDISGPLIVGDSTQFSMTCGDWMFAATGDDLRFLDDGGQEIFRISDDAASYHAKVTGPMHVTGEIKLDGALNHDGTTAGFFNSTPISKPTVSGARDNPEEALDDLLSELANLGLITNNTTAS